MAKGFSRGIDVVAAARGIYRDPSSQEDISDGTSPSTSILKTDIVDVVDVPQFSSDAPIAEQPVESIPEVEQGVETPIATELQSDQQASLAPVESVDTIEPTSDEVVLPEVVATVGDVTTPPGYMLTNEEQEELFADMDEETFLRDQQKQSAEIYNASITKGGEDLPIEDVNPLTNQPRLSVFQRKKDKELQAAGININKDNMPAGYRNELGVLSAGGFLQEVERRREELENSEVDYDTDPTRTSLGLGFQREDGTGEVTLTHRVGYMGETFLIQSAGLVDLVKDFVTAPIRERAQRWTTPYLVIDGKVHKDFSDPEKGPGAIEELMIDTIVSTKGIFGLEPGLEKAEDWADSIPYTAGSWAAGSATFRLGGAIVKGATSALKNSTTSLDSFFKGYNAAELQLGAIATIAAPIAVKAFEEDDVSGKAVERTSDMAQLTTAISPMGLLAVAAGKGLWNTSVFVTELKKTGLVDSAKKLADGDKGLIEASEKEVSKLIKRYASMGDLPAMNKRLSQVKAIRAEFPDYNPGIAVIIDVPELTFKSKQVDTMFIEEASQQFNKNQKIVKEMIDRRVSAINRITTPGGGRAKATEELSNLIHIRAKEGEVFNKQLSMAADNALEDARNAAVFGGDLESKQSKIMDQLLSVRKEMNGRVDVLANAVDPSGLVQVKQGDISPLIDYHLGRMISLNKTTASSDEAHKFLQDVFPSRVLDQLGDDFRAASERSSKAARDVDRSGTGVKLPAYRGPSENLPDINTNIDYGSLRDLMRQLSKKANQIKDSGTDTQGYIELTGLRASLEKMFVNKVTDLGDGDIVHRYEKFKSFYRDIYSPAFKAETSVGTRFTDKTNSSYEVFKKNADMVGKTLFKRDTQTTDLKDFLRTIKDSEAEPYLLNNLHDYVIGSLNNKLVDSIDPVKDINKFTKAYGVSIDLIPEMATRIDVIRSEVVRNMSDNLGKIARIVDIEKNVIAKYSGVEPSELINRLITSSPEETSRMIRAIQEGQSSAVRAANKIAPDDSLYQGLGKLNTRLELDDLQNLTRTLTGATQDKIFTRFMRDDGTLNSADMTNYINKHEEQLTIIMGKPEIDSMKNLAVLDVFSPKKLRPTKNEDIDEFSNRMKALGLSPASISARYYAVQLGKVSKSYVLIDNLSKIMFKASRKMYGSAYQKELQDLDGLQNVLNNFKNEDYYKESLKMKGFFGGLSDGTVALTKKTWNDFTKELPTRIIQGNLSYDRMVENDGLFDEDVRKVVNRLAKVPNDRSRLSLDILSEDDYEYIKPSSRKDSSFTKPIVTPYKGVDKVIPRQGSSKNATQVAPDEASATPHQPQPLPNTPDEQILADSAAEILGYRREQAKLRQDKITKTGRLNTKTGEMTWLS